MGYIIYTNGSQVSWKSEKQGLVTTSTFAAEYVASSNTSRNSQYTKNIFGEMGVKTVETPKILEDNRGVVLTVNGTGSNPSNNKHVDIKEKLVQDKVRKGELTVESIGTQENVSDTFTKALAFPLFTKHLPNLMFDNRYSIRSLGAMFVSNK